MTPVALRTGPTHCFSLSGGRGGPTLESHSLHSAAKTTTTPTMPGMDGTSPAVSPSSTTQQRQPPFANPPRPHCILSGPFYLLPARRPPWETDDDLSFFSSSATSPSSVSTTHCSGQLSGVPTFISRRGPFGGGFAIRCSSGSFDFF